MNDKLQTLATPYRPEFTYLLLVMFLTFCQRIAIPIGHLQLSPTQVALYCVLAYWLLRSQLAINSTRLLLFVAGMVGLFTAFAVNFYSPYVSKVSILLVVTLYFPWVIVHRDPRGPLPVYRYFRLCATVVGVLGILQFAWQLAGFTYNDPYDRLPENWVLRGFNSYQPLSFGSSFIKSNGIIMAEASYYSRHLAMALILEVLIFKNVWRGAFFIVALLPSFSGTGLIVLLITSPWLFAARPRLMLSLGAVASVIAIPFLLSPYGEKFWGRTEEFSRADSSAYTRFVSPYVRLAKTYDQWLVAGHGPGTVEQFENVREPSTVKPKKGQSIIPVRDAYANSLVKLLYEYGLVCSFPFLIFMHYCYFRRPWLPPLALALYASHFYLGGSLVQAKTVELCYILGFLHPFPPLTFDSSDEAEPSTAAEVPQESLA